MAKGRPSYNYGPWQMTKKELDEFVAVTADNRHNAAVLGRILYVIEGATYRGHFVLSAAAKKGQNIIPRKPWDEGYPNPQTVYIPEDIDADRSYSDFKKLVSKFIEEGTLFIKPSDPILKFNQ